MATIQGVYVALFGRPADPAGLAYFNAQTKNGADLTKIGDLASTQEYKDRFAGQNNVQIVTAIYQSLFNRDPEAAGLNFFVNALNNGTLSINNIAIAILDGAQGTDKLTVDNKITAANNFTAAIDTPVEQGLYVGNDAAQAGRNFLAGVTSDVATIPTAAATDQAIADIGTASNTGNTVNLATVTDVTIGSVDADPLTPSNKATGLNDTINGAAAGNWVNADKIDGGFGTDTLTAVVNAALTEPAEVKNVEIFNLSASAAAVISFKNVTGEQQVWNKTTGAFALTVNDITLGTAIGLEGTVGGAATFDFADATGTSDSATLVTKGAGVTGGVNIGEIETLTISNTSGSTLGTVTLGADAKAVVFTGSGTVSATLSGANIASITNTGTVGVTTDVSALEKLATFTSAGGIDFITTNTAGLTVNQTINAGAGADTVTVAGAGATGFTLTVTGGLGADQFNVGTGTALANVNAVDTAANLVKSLVTITDFTKAQGDLLSYNSAGGANVSLNTNQLEQIAAQTDLLAATTKAASFLTATAKDTAVFSFGSDTYIYTDVDGSNTVNTGDALVKLTGVAVADLTTTNFTFA